MSKLEHTLTGEKVREPLEHYSERIKAMNEKIRKAIAEAKGTLYGG